VYLKRGIESWQPAFEAAGFKNAIIAKEAPTGRLAFAGRPFAYSDGAEAIAA
jgi:hypothetical protein